MAICSSSRILCFRDLISAGTWTPRIVTISIGFVGLLFHFRLWLGSRLPVVLDFEAFSQLLLDPDLEKLLPPEVPFSPLREVVWMTSGSALLLSDDQFLVIYPLPIVRVRLVPGASESIRDFRLTFDPAPSSPPPFELPDLPSSSSNERRCSISRMRRQRRSLSFSGSGSWALESAERDLKRRGDDDEAPMTSASGGSEGSRRRDFRAESDGFPADCVTSDCHEHNVLKVNSIYKYRFLKICFLN